MSASVKERLAQRAALVEEYLAKSLRGQDIPARLRQAMEYSLMAGGKRLRPVLCTSFCHLFGGEHEVALPFAAGLEFIHTYSLIHDDLPAMDDRRLEKGHALQPQEVRRGHGHPGRGRPVDRGLQAHVLRHGLGRPCGKTWSWPWPRPPGTPVHAAWWAGQVLDMAYTGRSDVPLAELKTMHARKTGAMIAGSCLCGALMALPVRDPDNNERLSAAELYGWHLGAAFQIIDDVLDVVGDQKLLGKPVGSDQEMGKTTYPGLLGLDESVRLARAEADGAVSVLTGYVGEDAEFLRDLAQYVVDRAC